MEYIRASRETRQALVISDPQPVGSVGSLWLSVSQTANVGIFLVLLGAVLYFGRSLFLPISIAAIVALTLAPVVKAAKLRGISPWITASLIVFLSIGALAIAVTAMAGPVSEWIQRAPEIGASVKQKLHVLDPPLAALRELQNALFGGASGSKAPISAPSDMVLPVVAFATPAVADFLLFFVTLLFFLVGQTRLRARLVSLLSDHEAKLRLLRIMNDIERNLAGYLAVVTIINAALGAIVAIGAWILGFPDPVILGVLAAVLNYVPYVGPAVMVAVLFAIELVSFPSLGYALLGPAGFVALTTAEGHFITPTIVGRRMTLNPLVVILALAFWTWMWGPVGAFLAVPVSIIGLVVIHHLLPQDDGKIPD